MSQRASSGAACFTAGEREVPNGHPGAGLSLCGHQQPLDWNFIAFPLLTSQTPLGDYYQAFLWLKSPLAIFYKPKGGRRACRIYQQMHRSQHVNPES